MVALDEHYPVLASLSGAGDSIDIDPAYLKAVFMDNVISLSAVSGGYHLLVEREGCHYQ